MGTIRKVGWLTKRLNLESDQRSYYLARTGIVPCVRIGKQIRFDEDVIEDFIDKGGKGLDGNEEPRRLQA